MQTHDLTLEDLKRHRRQAATLVKLHGAEYLPFFQLFDAEIQRMEATENDLDRALQFAEL